MFMAIAVAARWIAVGGRCDADAGHPTSVDPPIRQPAHGTSTDLMTRRSCIASNASRQPSSGARSPTISVGQRRAAVEQMDHALPDRIVVAERSLQAQVLLDQRVESIGNEVRRPADLGDLAVRTREPQRQLERSLRRTRRTRVGAERRQAADDLLDVSPSATSTVLASRRAGAPSRAAPRPPTGRRRSADRRRPAPPCARRAGRSGRARARRRGRPAGSSSSRTSRCRRRRAARPGTRGRTAACRGSRCRQRAGTAHVLRHRAVRRRSRIPCATDRGCSVRSGTACTRRRSPRPSR